MAGTWLRWSSLQAATAPFFPHRLRLSLGLTLLFCSLAISPLHAQFGDDKKEKPSANGIKFDKQKTQRWKVGFVIKAGGSPCQGVYCTIPVPIDWPEQSVKRVSEELSPHIGKVSFRMLDQGAKQMLVEIPSIPAGDTATAVFVFDVTRSSILPPDDTSLFKIPDRLPTAIQKLLGPSPKIEARDARILKLAKEIVADKETAWEKVEAIYDWVREHVEYREGDLKGAVAALKDKTGDCEDMSSLFIALCRANKIPARTVWIPDHCYPEFYLVDDKGQGHWIPCQAAGTRDFGGIPEFRPVLQKGDNFKVPESKEPQRYAAEFLVAKKGRPSLESIRQLMQTE